jgi:hypothetical protein
MKIKLVILNCFNFFVALAQPPNTDVWLFKLQIKDKHLVIKSGSNITKRDGYDNQPCFSNDGKKIYYSSIREDKQADIYCYDLKKEKTIQLTKTVVSEYSPTTLSDSKTLACVSVLKDSSQIIQSLKIDKTNLISKIAQLVNTDSIGYFTFLNADTIIYYKLTQPHSLRFHSISTNEDFLLGNNPIRGFKPINRHLLIYGLKDSTSVTFYKYNFVLHKSEKFVRYNSLNEDIIWHSTWGLIKSEGTKLLNYNSTKNEWEVLFDLTSFGLKKITRFNFDAKNNYLVVVDNN